MRRDGRVTREPTGPAGGGTAAGIDPKGERMLSRDQRKARSHGAKRARRRPAGAEGGVLFFLLPVILTLGEF